MSPTEVPGIAAHSPALYEIRVKGALDEAWCELMEGMSLTVISEGSHAVTVIRVVVPDQAALAGLLDSLFRLNSTVLSVEALDA